MKAAGLILGLGLLTRLPAAELDPWFGDGMVLQRDRPIRITGTAQAGATVQVTLGAEKGSVRADAQGRWSATFAGRPASTRPTELEATDAERTYTAHDILIGDVWICAGQSNMEFPLSREASAKTELPAATLPLVRLRNHSFAGQYRYSAPLDATSVSLMTERDFYRGRWEPCTPKSAALTTAVGYYFAKRIADETGVPIGLVNYAIGGAPIEAFISREAMAADPTFRKKVTGNWLENESIEGTFVRLRGRQHVGSATNAPGDDLGPNHGFKPGFAWAAGPGRIPDQAVKGVLWYQGESNAIRLEDVTEYGPLMKILVADWRARWRQSDLPFYWVQLPSMDEPARRFWPEFREVQRQLVAQIPHTGMAIALDVGTPRDVHPRNKLTVGERLAALALRDLYGRRDLIAEGPTPTAAKRDGKTVRITFRSGAGLSLAPKTVPLLETRAPNTDEFKKALNSHLEGDVLVVEAPGPIAEIRYAWHMNGPAALFNGAGLPAAPFTLKVSE